jgi:hypothetical protein
MFPVDRTNTPKKSGKFDKFQNCEFEQKYLEFVKKN